VVTMDRALLKTKDSSKFKYYIINNISNQNNYFIFVLKKR
jgi:hypothetical protein